MVEADEYIRIHHGSSYLCILYIFATLDRNLHVVGTLETVGYDDGTARGDSVESVFVCAEQVLHRILA